MKIATVSSNDVRDKWRDIVDGIHRDKRAVVVERYNKPVTAIIDYELFLQLQKKLGIQFEFLLEGDDIEEN